MRRAGAALLLAALLALPAAAPADRREDLEALRRAIAESRSRVDDYEREQRGLLEALEGLDQTALLLAREVRRARQQERAAREALSAIEEQAARLEQKLDATRRAMSARAVALYRAGELGSVRLLFGADSLPGFLSRVSSLRLLLDHDRDLLARHRAESEALASARVEARASAEALASASAELGGRQTELAREREGRRLLVARLHLDRTRERSALVELEKAARALEETLARIGDEPGDGAGELAGPPFPSLRRQLDAPVDAPILHRFGREVDARFLTQTFHSGWVFGAPPGTPVRAVAAGRVRFAGWFRGYGRLVILDHGGGYFTVSGHLDAIDVAVGDRVDAGGVIGSVGETGSLSGPRLYFEIRQGAEALDPADWLRQPRAG